MRFNFHGKHSNNDKQKFSVAQEEDLIKICDYLETDKHLLASVRFEIFDTREAKQEADPNHSISRASARFDEMTIYKVWTPDDDSRFPHEITHLVAHTWAKPYLFTVDLDTADDKKVEKNIEMVSTSFMQEGLAVAVDDIVFGRKLLEDGEHKFIDVWCQEQLDKLPTTLKQVINLDGFGSMENKVVVPFTGSLSKYFLQTFGIEKYKEVYSNLRETASSLENIEVIERVCGLSEEAILKGWQLGLNEAENLH